MKRIKPHLEVHEHWFIIGPYANRADQHTLVHSHEGGQESHEHEDQVHRTGPAAYTIDRDEWFRQTGLRGGGRKRYTSKPSGQQLPLVSVEPPQIRVVVVGDGVASLLPAGCSGAGILPIARMVLAFHADVVQGS